VRFPERLVEKIIYKLLSELLTKKYIEVEDVDYFKKQLLAIFKEADEEEKNLDEKAKEILKDQLSYIEKENIDYRTAHRTIRMKLAEEMKIETKPRERMNQITNRIRDLIKNDPNIEIYEDIPMIRKVISSILIEASKEEEEIEKEVRMRIKKYSKKIVEGTSEWNILYNRIYQDTLKQRGLA
jgi:Uncharacterized protein conserved in bacteria